MSDTHGVHGDLDLILLAETAERFRFAPAHRQWGSETFVVPSEEFGVDSAFTFRPAKSQPTLYLPWLQDVAAHGEPACLFRLSALERLNAHGPLNEQNPAWMALQRFLEAALPHSAAWCFVLSHASEGPYEVEFGDLPRVLQRLQGYAEEGTHQSFAVRFPSSTSWVAP
ncbi:hypothetical protein [Deinococcus enclensis]|uniref:DUF4123 domain-containing protein n=1 Tax=Deinococcus enclensis TaxID=1049582 RepID=A0ABT9MF79_9DEIO|nr:hypothetical protein [Deinococcus enclensis]MDP9765116.1 hypothetical protein [Deinococcus enclensis]